MTSASKPSSTRSVTFQDDQFLIGDERVPFLSGQIDYWQHIRMYWPRILESVKNCALPIVSFYVPWNFHEVAPGQWDFEGVTEPQRDLAAFLDLAADQGLWIFARPGPWIYDHWKEGGIPPHAAQYHRLHPEFLRQARAYVEAVCQVLRPRLATRGGRIILCQPDNEIDMHGNEESPHIWVDWNRLGPTYYDQVIANGQVDDPYSYRHWLMEKYGKVETLNRYHGTAFHDFAAVQAISLETATSSTDKMLSPSKNAVQGVNNRLQTYAEYRRLADLLEFMEWYVAEYARIITGYYTDESIDVPILLNTYPVLEPQNSVLLQEIGDLVGTDPWYQNLVPWESVLKYSLHTRHLRSATRTPVSGEYQSITAGELVDIEHVVMPQNAIYLCMLAMHLGLKGWNWFVFAERSVLYFAPINNFGEPVRAYYPNFQRMHQVFQNLEWPRCQKVTHSGLFWYRPHYWFEAQWDNPPSRGGFAFSEVPQDTVWQRLFEDLHLADIDIEIFDPTAAHNKLRQDGLLFFAGYQFMDVEAQQRLLSRAEEGGHLVFVTSPPNRDLASNATDVFSFLPAPCGIVTPPSRIIVNIAGQELEVETRALAVYQPPVGALPILSRFGVCGYTLQVGAGKITVLGCEVGAAALPQLHDILDVPMSSRCDQARVLTSAWTRGDDHLVVAVNCNDESRRTNVLLNLAALDLKSTSRYEVRGAMRVAPWHCTGQDLARIELDLPAKDGEILTITLSSEP